MKHFFTRLAILICTVAIGSANICLAQTESQSPADSTLSILKKDTLNNRKPTTLPIVTPNKPIVKTAADTLKKPQPWQPNPKKTGLYSALLPGLGQLYNRQYWKIPVVYAGMGTITYFFIQNLNNYQSYRKAYLGRTNNPYPTDEYVGIYSTDQLQQLQNDYNRYMNLTVLFGAIGYTLEVLDAITSAHLKNFDISRDISMRMRPVAMPQGIGMGLVLNFNPRVKMASHIGF